MSTRPLPFRTIVVAIALSSAAPASADFRVFERNAPQPNPPAAQPAPSAPPVEVTTPEATTDGATLEGSTTDDAAIEGSTTREGQPPVDATGATSEQAALPATETPAPPEPHRGEHSYLDVTGFVQPGFIARFTDANAASQDSTFILQRARIGLRAQITRWLRIRLELELAPTPNLQDAYVDVVPHEAIQFRVGQFLVPFLEVFQFNELNLGFIDRPIYTPLTPDRPFIRYLSPRDIGAMAFGRIGNLDPEVRRPTLEYYAGAFLGRGANQNQNTDQAFLYTLRTQLHFFGRPIGADAESDIARNLHPRLALGTALYSNCDDRTNWNRGFTADLEHRYKGLYASAAIVWFRNGPATGHGAGEFLGYSKCVGSYLDSMGRPSDFVSRGAHVQVQYVLPHRLFPVNGQNLELLFRYDVADPVSPYDSSRPLLGGGGTSPGYVAPQRINDADNAPTQWRLTFGLNYFPTGRQSLRVSLNYQLNREGETIVTSAGALTGVKNDALWLQLTAGL